MATGEELLIADTTDRDREGLRQLFDGHGFVCTAAAPPDAARDSIRRKFFPVALVDLDFGGPSGGIALIHYIRQHSSPTRVVLLAGRRSFDAAVEALRAGVVDIVSKRPDQVDHLFSAVHRAVDRYRAGDKEGALLREVRGVLDESFNIMMGLCRRLHGSSSNDNLAIKPTILLVDEDQEFLTEVATLLDEMPWDVSVELSGGSGLDKASTFSFQILAVRQQLMDLPGHMLIKSAQAQKPFTLGLLYDATNHQLQHYEAGNVTFTEPEFNGPEHLVESLAKLVDNLGNIREERRYLQMFRAEHGTFLKRYAALKTRIDSVAE